MKYLKTYNESIKHLLKPKSKEDILKELEKLSDSDRIIKIIKYKLSYDLLPKNLIVNGDLDCSDKKLIELPDNLTVNGNLYCFNNQLTKLPDNLIIKGYLNCSVNELTKLPDNLIVHGSLDCCDNKLIELPDNLIVKGNLYCTNNKLPKDTKKPKGVKGKMHL